MEEKDTRKDNTVFNGQELNSALTNSFYHKHSLMSVTIKKTEKVVTAIYMVTDFISETEPLRYELRTLSLRLLSGTRKLGARSSDQEYALIDDVKRTIDEIASLVTLASTIGLVSEMNGRILTSEMQKMRKTIEEIFSGVNISVRMHPGYANVILSERMFEVEESDVPKIPTEPYKGQESIKGQNIHTSVLYKNDTEVKNKIGTVNKRTEVGIKIARRNDVLTIVKSKGSVSVKDIALVLKDTGEKTIQRELHNLVAEGVLKKEGEKRWSTYRLA